MTFSKKLLSCRRDLGSSWESWIAPCLKVQPSAPVPLHFDCLKQYRKDISRGTLILLKERWVPFRFLEKSSRALVALLTGELCFHQYKATLVMKVEMTKTTPDGKSKNMSPYFASKPLMITSQQDIEPVIRQAHQRIDSQIDKWTTEGSGWAVIRVMCLYVNIAKYQPLTGSSYVELPPTLKHKKVMLR